LTKCQAKVASHFTKGEKKIKKIAGATASRNERIMAGKV
jgi:hypothetical protein